MQPAQQYGLLCQCERPSRREDRRADLEEQPAAAVHPITRLAHSSNVCETVKPRGFAVGAPEKTTPTRTIFPVCCALAANGASARLTVRTTASPICRIDMSPLEDWLAGV